VPDSLHIAYARGVTPGKWARIWHERFPRVQLELTMMNAVTDASAQLAVLRAGADSTAGRPATASDGEGGPGADLAFIRLPVGPDGESVWPGGARPGDIHFIALYEELPFVVAPKGNVLEAADEVTVADLDGEVKHPFDDDIQTTIEVVAANVGVVIVPQSIARLYARKDVIARPVTDAPGWRIGLAWPRASRDPRVDDFVGVVRGRTANSSRGAASAVPRSADGGDRPQRRGTARPSRGARKGRRSTR